MYRAEYKVTKMERLKNSSMGSPIFKIWYYSPYSGVHYVSETKPNTSACYSASESQMIGKTVSFDFDGSYIIRIHYPNE